MNKIGVFKIVDEAQIPSIGTMESACFDLAACFHRPEVKFNGGRSNTLVAVNSVTEEKSIIMYPGDRALIPTGLIFLLPLMWQLKIIPRSGMAWKRGLTMINSPGTVDSDYTDEIFILAHNASPDIVTIIEGERIAQAELMMNHSPTIKFIPVVYDDVLTHKDRSNRDGGFGSTGD